MIRSPWLRVCDMRLHALFRLAFAPAPPLRRLNLAAYRNSQVYSTKDTPLPSRAVTSCQFMVSGSISLPSPGFFSPFPHGTCTLSVAAGVQPWIVVDPDSDRVPRAPPYSGYRGRPDPPDTRLSRSPAPLPSGFSSGPVFSKLPYAVLQPRLRGLGFSHFARRYSGNLC